METYINYYNKLLLIIFRFTPQVTDGHRVYWIKKCDKFTQPQTLKILSRTVIFFNG